jgi:hypothetical protein
MGGGNSGQQQESAASAQQQANSQQLFNVAEPGLQTAENYYQNLASGNPTQMFAAVAPSVNSVIGNTEQAKQNILQNDPRGGTQDLALQQADISKAAQIGNLQSSAYTSSFPALANLAQTGLGISTNEAQNAIQGYGQVAQSQSADKASSMGFLGSLAGAGGSVLGGL